MSKMTDDLKWHTKTFIEEYRRKGAIEDTKTFTYVLNTHLIRRRAGQVNETECAHTIKSKYHLLYNISMAAHWLDKVAFLNEQI